MTAFRQDINIELAIRLYQTESVCEVSRQLGVSDTVMARHLRRAGVTIRPSHKGINLGVKNGIWKGDEVEKSALHHWVKRHLPKPDWCQDCGIVSPKDLANVSQEYRRDLLDWEWLCRKCHMTKDGRIARLIARNKGV